MCYSCICRPLSEISYVDEQDRTLLISAAHGISFPSHMLTLHFQTNLHKFAMAKRETGLAVFLVIKALYGLLNSTLALQLLLLQQRVTSQLSCGVL